MSFSLLRKIWDHWVFGLGPFGTLENTTFRELDLFPSVSQGVGGTCYRSNFRNIVFFSVFIEYRTVDRV
jgi:hypothetical protein